MRRAGTHRQAEVWFGLALVLVGLLSIAATAWLRRDFYYGDPAVYLTFARNAAHGHPFTFNPGEFSSGSTSPLWSLLLAIPFVVGAGIAGTKVFAFLATAGAFLVTVGSASRLTGSWPAASVGGLYLVAAMTVPGIGGYESPLVVAVSALSLVAMQRARRRWQAAGALRLAALSPLLIAWAVLPLARPDAVLLVALEAAALWAFGSDRGARPALVILVGVALALLPAAAYFGYSLAHLGSLSTAADARLFTDREYYVPRWHAGPLTLAKSAFQYVLEPPAVLWMIPAVAGLGLAARDPGRRWFAAYGGAALGGYVAVITVANLGGYAGRYLLAVAPVVVVGVAFALTALRGSRAWLPALVVSALVFALAAIDDTAGRAWRIDGPFPTADVVLGRDAMRRVNALAAPGDTVLAYEVQSRYYLRSDLRILSLDGITDGRVSPYLGKGDLTAFLEKERPRFWIQSRLRPPPLRDSVLGRVIDLALPKPHVRYVALRGLRFRVLARHPGPWPFNWPGWQMIVEIRYPGER